MPDGRHAISASADDAVEYAKWKSFRESEDSRHVGLTVPRILLMYGQVIVER
jgi:type VI secretion system protein ImpC